MKNHFRNSKELTSIEGVLVDAGSLWLLDGDVMILVDEDQYVTHVHDEHFVSD